MSEFENNPNNLSVHDVALYILGEIGYRGYDMLTRQRMINSLGPVILPPLVEFPESDDAA